MVKINRFYITADRYNVILQEEKIKTSGENIGEKYMESIGYYRDLEGAVMAAYRILSGEKIAESKIKDVETQVKELKKLKEELKKEMSDIKWEK